MGLFGFVLILSLQRTLLPQYGGSITVDSAADYLAISGLDGLLVGAASLDIHQFTEIIEKAHKG